MSNPFTPTFGTVPVFPAGRKYIMEDMKSAFENWKTNPSISSLLIGPRGSGKTALLSMIGDEARKQGWIVIHCSAEEGMKENIYQKILIASSDLIDTKQNLQISDINIGKYIGLSFSPSNTIEYNWQNRMSILLSKINEFGTGILIAVDEVDVAENEMAELVSSYQIFRRENKKISLIMAGLPGNIYSLLNDKKITFLRRANQYYLGRIDDSDIRQMFRKTIENAGRTISKPALDLSVTAIKGYAYMMQLIGYYVWEDSDDNKEISVKNAESGISIATEKFKNSVLESTYLELSEGDIRFLFAMLEDKEFSQLKNIAIRLGKSNGYANIYKKRLLKDGIIEEKAGKKLQIILPSFREYLLEQKEEEK